MTIDELAELLEQLQDEGRGEDLVAVRGYESGLDEIARAVDADVLVNRRSEVYYGPHEIVRAEEFVGHRGAGETFPLADERVLWLVGSRDVDGERIDPEGSGW